MSGQEQSTFEDLFFELSQDEDFRRHYDRQKPYYDLLREIIALRKSLGITQEELAPTIATVNQSTRFLMSFRSWRKLCSSYTTHSSKGVVGP